MHGDRPSSWKEVRKRGVSTGRGMDDDECMDSFPCGTQQIQKIIYIAWTLAVLLEGVKIGYRGMKWDGEDCYSLLC